MSVPVFAQFNNCPLDDPGCSGNVTNFPEVAATPDALRTGLGIVFGILAVVAVIYIIMGALKLVASQGDPQALSKARRTIIYAAIGLVVAVSAEVIVTLVLNRA